MLTPVKLDPGLHRDPSPTETAAHARGGCEAMRVRKGGQEGALKYI